MSRCTYDYGNDDGRLHQGKGTARALYTLQQGPRSTKRAPSTAIESQGVGAGRAQLATSRVTGPVLAASSTSECALSFAVVTEWPVGV